MEPAEANGLGVFGHQDPGIAWCRSCTEVRRQEEEEGIVIESQDLIRFSSVSQLHLGPVTFIYGVGYVDVCLRTLVTMCKRGSVFLTLALRDVLRFTTSVTTCEFYIWSDIQFRGGC
eukprot:g82448.t1